MIDGFRPCPSHCSQQSIARSVLGESKGLRIRNCNPIFVELAVAPNHGPLMVLQQKDSGEEPIKHAIVDRHRKHQNAGTGLTGAHSRRRFQFDD